MGRVWWIAAWLGASTCASVASAAASSGLPGSPGPADLLPLEDFARAPAVRGVQVSPDGDRLASIETIDGRGSIVVRRADGGDRRVLYRNPARSIEGVAWSGDGRWLWFFQDASGDEGFHLFRLDPRAAEPAPTDLTPFPGVSVEKISTPVLRGATLLVTMNRRDPAWPDAFAVDLATGTATELDRNRHGITEYFGDAVGRLRAGTAIRADGRLDLLALSGGTWTPVYSAAADERFKVLSVTHDGAAAIVRSNRHRLREELAHVELASGALTPAGPHACGRFDVDDVALSPRGLAMVACTTEVAGLVGRDARSRRALAAVRALAGAGAGLTLESRSPDGRWLVVHADASDRPGRYILSGPDARARVVGETRPWLLNHRLAQTTAHWVTARDGLPLLAYVTRPAAAPGPTPDPAGPRSTVIALHGGPWSRDAGGFEATTQWLASRGYTVIQVNFRGSTGLGRAVFEGGVGEFGGRMSDDVDDVAAWAVARGLSRNDRLCLMGGSYGGFAVLTGMVREPWRYACGIDFAGPVDLVTLVEAFPPAWKPFLPRSWYRFVGDPAKPTDRATMAAHSPLPQAERIVSPLLVFQGANDPRVTRAQPDTLVCRLRSRGVAVDYLLSGSEGHSFTNEETSLAVNRAAETFLARHLGGRAQAGFDAAADQALADLRGAGDRLACP